MALVYVHGSGRYLGDLDGWEPRRSATSGLAIQVLVYPAVDLTRSPDPIEDPADPDLSPLYAPDLAGLPPAVVCVAEYDVLRAQALAYAERLRAAGVSVDVLDAHALDHAFLAWGTFARRPAEAIAELGEAVRTMLARAGP